jgi:hypothetical protein
VAFEATAPAAQGAEAAPEQREVRPRRLGTLAWTTIVAVVALGSSISALVFTLWPSLRPDPRDELGASVGVFAVDPNVSYRTYLERTTFEPGDLARRERAACGGTRANCGFLNLPGEQVYVETMVKGFKRRAVVLRLSLYKFPSRERVEGASAVEVARQHLDAPTDSAVVPVWLLCPPERRGSYFVRVELYHRGDDLLLAVADSKPFTATCR